ncbi:MAG: hypothetical protein J5J06_01525 [Phycisphaerae bacterium]|nr:hypothetical protein [Phycisphaerae bacterium]
MTNPRFGLRAERAPTPAAAGGTRSDQCGLRVGRRLAAWLLATCLVLAGAITAQARPQTFGSSRGVLPDSAGAIAEVIIQYDPDLYTESLPLFTDLLNALSPRTHVTVLVPSNEGITDVMSAWGPDLTANGRSATIINVGLHLSIWARDRYIPRQPFSLVGSAAGFLSAPYPELEQAKINELLAYQTLGAFGVIAEPSDLGLRLEGGNVVANRRHVFVGANVFAENDVPASSAPLRQSLREVFGREYVVVRDRNDLVPWVHVDMYLTPIDDTTVLVGSVTAAADILRESGEGYLIGAAEDAEECGPLGSIGDACLSDIVETSLDDVAEQVRGLGYRVIRSPVVPDVPDDWMLTYNNVVLERRNGRRYAIVPVYNVPSLDNAAVDLYRSLGFDVHAVDVSGIYRLGGALRCVTNVARRTRVGTTRSAAAVTEENKPGYLMVLDLTSNDETIQPDHPCLPEPESEFAPLEAGPPPFRYEQSVR